ncbi:mannosyltransferase family protein [Streptomyces sp. NPDC048362]|uniref:mannosyltransferase family protein n=1 Tax=Streptomyces sp. NPDC048362 TaxID=3365539 RepID=UPI0037154970
MSTFSAPRRSTSLPATGQGPPGVSLALALFAGLRLAGIAVVAVVDHLTGRTAGKSLAHSWDSVWYLHIAEHGYGTRIRITGSGAVQTDWAFFPLYPGLVRGLRDLVPISAGKAGLLIAWSAAVLAAYGIYAIGHHLYGRAVATTLVALWAALPHSVVLTLAYTEPVFTTCAAWSLYAVLKGRWLTAGSLAALAGLARPNGIAAAVAVAVAAVHEVIRQRGRVPRGLWSGVLLGPLGWVGYVLWVGGQTGDLLHGYFQVQSAWNSRLDLGVGSLRFVKSLLLHGGKVTFPVAVVVVAVSVLLFCLLCLDRAPLPLVVFAGVLLLLVLAVSGPFSSKPRFLLPAFPLLIPLARALVRACHSSLARAVLVGGTLATVSVAYGAYLAVLAHEPL